MVTITGITNIEKKQNSLNMKKVKEITEDELYRRIFKTLN